VNSAAELAASGKRVLLLEEFGLRYETIEATASVNATGAKPHYYSLNTRAADFGYQPSLTSLEGIMRESEKILNPRDE
jgi:hypothetical protein